MNAQYKFNNYLGNVLVTFSNMVDGYDDGILDYYMGNMLIASDYDPVY